MTRLIDADALKKGNERLLHCDFPYLSEMTLEELIDEAPTINAEPVRHGKWELAEDGWYCSACELYPPFDCDPEEKGIPYCPYCGARMDKERKEEWTILNWR